MEGIPSGPKWQEAIALSGQILTDRGTLEDQEILYKKDISANIQAAFDVVKAGGPILPAVRKAFGKPNNLIYHLQMTWFKAWVADDEAAAREALLTLTGSDPVAERVDAFNAHVPEGVLKTPGARIGIASFFLMGLDPAQFPMYRPNAIKGAEKILEWPPEPDGSPGEQYEHHVAFVRCFLEQLQNARLDAHDMLDAQSLIWCLMTNSEPEFLAWRNEDQTQTLNQRPPSGEAPTLEDLARSLYVDEAFLDEVMNLLSEKSQLIFYGPPGAGKTFIARHLSRFIAEEDPGRFNVVQFHPSYSYEDFVQGFRPRLDSAGNLTYELVDGPLLQMAGRAHARPDEPHVLLIDEINRGNLPRIFGELLYLLEYREDGISLMYSADQGLFALPENLWFIGTMNTADRSIGLIDAALRRRFHFKALFPGRPPLDGLLKRWLDDKVPGMVEVATYVDRLNAKLRERFGDHLQVGHSYFMDERLNDARLKQIWETDIMPFLEDQLFGKEAELDQFRLAAIKGQPGAGGHAIEEGEVDDADDKPVRAQDPG